MDQQLQTIEQIAATLVNPDQRQALEQAVRELRQAAEPAGELDQALADAREAMQAIRERRPTGVPVDVLWARVGALAAVAERRPLFPPEELVVGEALSGPGLGDLVDAIRDLAERPAINSLVRQSPSAGKRAPGHASKDGGL